MKKLACFIAVAMIAFFVVTGINKLDDVTSNNKVLDTSEEIENMIEEKVETETIETETKIEDDWITDSNGVRYQVDGDLISLDPDSYDGENYEAIRIENGKVILIPIPKYDYGDNHDEVLDAYWDLKLGKVKDTEYYKELEYNCRKNSNF